MKCRVLLTLAVGLLAIADGFGVPDWPANKPKIRSDMDQLQGTWTATSWESGGVRNKGNLQVVVRKNQWVLTINGEIIKGTVKLDPTRKVKTFDATVTEGAGRGLTVLGIYRLEGNTLIACWTLQEQVRPREFVSKADGSNILFVLKRPRRAR